MGILNFNNWNRINEAIIDWDERGDLKEFYEDSLDLLRLNRTLSTADLKAIGDNNGVEVVTYDEFLDELPEEYKHTAPPRQAGLFALVNPDTQGPRVVIAIPVIDKRALDHIYHMLKHEVIHIGQFARRPEEVPFDLPDPSDQKAYFSNKDEVMAFSHSMADMLMSAPKDYSSPSKAMEDLNSLRLYTTIKKNVDAKTLKRYHKYIYQYLEKEFVRE